MIQNRDDKKDATSVERLRIIVGKHVREEVIQFHLQSHRHNPWWAANSYLIEKFVNCDVKSPSSDSTCDSQSLETNSPNHNTKQKVFGAFKKVERNNNCQYTKQYKRSSGFQSLPIELIYDILEYLTAQELVTMQLVSKEYKEIARSCILWKKHYFHRYTTNPSNKYPYYSISTFEHFLQHRSLPETTVIHDENIKIMLNRRPNNTILGNNDILTGSDIHHQRPPNLPLHSNHFYSHPHDVINSDDEKKNDNGGNLIEEERRRIDHVPYYYQYIFNQLIEKEMRCPNCGICTILPVIYGYPSPSILQAAKQQKIILGGDGLVPEFSAFYGCVICRSKYSFYPWIDHLGDHHEQNVS